MEVAIVDSGLAAVKQEESTSSECRSVEEISKDLGHTQIVGKAETYEASKASKVVEENRATDVQAQVQESRSVLQSVTSQLSASSTRQGFHLQDEHNRQKTPATLTEQLNSIKQIETAILEVNSPSLNKDARSEVPTEYNSRKNPAVNAERKPTENCQQTIEKTPQNVNLFDATTLPNKPSNIDDETAPEFTSEQIGIYDEEIRNNFSHIDPYVFIAQELDDTNLKSPGLVREFATFHHQCHTDLIDDERIKATLNDVIYDLDVYAQRDAELNDDSLIGALKSRLTVRGDDQSQLSEDEIGPRHPINLEKIFTPAEDSLEIKPNKNRKMFASSAFYDSGFHPTVEDQVELARKISSSLSDASNKSSKGQNMYVNRKKRSVKWVHENKEIHNGHFQNGESSEQSMESKSMLKLVMNPLGQVQDMDSLKKQGFAIEAALSPDIYAGIVKDLNSTNGKGAELFAKRRKRSEKWIVGETNGSKNGMDSVDIIPSPAPLLSPLPPLASLISPAPGYLPETTKRIQHKEKLDEIQAQFIRPRLKLVKSPWEAALETGSVDTAFEDITQPPTWGATRGAHVAPTVAQYEQALQTNTLDSWKNDNAGLYQAQSGAYNSASVNRIVDSLQKGCADNLDVYQPTLPQAWNQQKCQNQPKQYSSSNTLPKILKESIPTAPAHATPPKPTVGVSADYATAYTPPKENIPPTKIHNLRFVNQYNNLQNYNTAARGWAQRQAVYKPVTFGNAGQQAAAAGWDYTDF